MKKLGEISYKKYYVIATVISFLAFVYCAAASHGDFFLLYLFGDQSDTGMDFFHSIAYTRGGHPYTQYYTLYPPLANLMFYFFTFFIPPYIQDKWGDDYYSQTELRCTPSDLRVQQAPMLIFMFFLITLVIFLLYLFISRDKWKRPKTNFILALCVMVSYPFLCALERGNIATLSLALLLYYLFNYNSETPWKRELAYICLALSTGLKLYPVVFGFLLLQERRWIPALRTMVYCLIAVFAPLLVLDGKEGLIFFVGKIMRAGGFSFPSVFSSGGSDSSAAVKTANAGAVIVAVKTGFFESIKMFFSSHKRLLIILACGLVLLFGERKLWQSCLLLGVAAFYIHPHWTYSLLIFIPALIFLIDEKEKDAYNLSQFIVLLFILLPYPLVTKGLDLRFKMVEIATVLCLIQEFFHLMSYIEKRVTKPSNQATE